MSKYRGISVVAVVAILSLAAFGCSSDDDDASADDDGSSTATSEAPSSSEQTTEPSTESTQDLPASFRGVTESSIKVGIAVPDFDALQTAGVANYQGDAEIAFQPFIDVINEEGGIFGRQIEPVYITFDFVDPITQESACTQFVEDHQVFIVLYGLLGESNLCLTDQNDTMVMTRSFQTTELRDRSGETLWLQLNARDDARMQILGDAAAESGRLENKTVGIVSRGTESDGPALQDSLESHGIDVVLLQTTAAGNDPVASDNELEIFAEQFISEGVDFVFDLRGGDDAAEVFARVGFTPEFGSKTLGPSVDGVTDRSVLDGAIGVGELNEQSMFEKPEFQASCMDVVRAANPELEEEMSFLPTGDEQAAGQPSWLNPIMIACDQTMLLQLLGEIAGADLTNDTFRAALDELGPVELHGYGQASFNSASKWDGLDEFYVQQYNFDTDSIEIIGDPIIVDRS